MRDRRFKDGAIAFDRYEVKFDIDENGKPLGTYIKESKEANKLIEEFMLLANRTVAEFIGKSKNKTKKTFVYRIHEQPDPEKLRDFSAFISRFGYKMRTEGTKTDISKGINKLLDSVQGKPEENLVETLAIRSMQKAHYTTDNIGHYGLAMDYYNSTCLYLMDERSAFEATISISEQCLQYSSYLFFITLRPPAR